MDRSRSPLSYRRAVPDPWILVVASRPHRSHCGSRGDHQGPRRYEYPADLIESGMDLYCSQLCGSTLGETAAGPVTADAGKRPHGADT